MPKKTVVSNFNEIDDNKSLTYDIKTMSKAFKDFFSHLAKSLLDKLPNPSDKYNLESYFFIARVLLSLSCFTLKVLQKKKFLK